MNVDTYEITLLNPAYEVDNEQVGLTSRRTLLFKAENFAHAEEQALQCVEPGEMVTEIKRDY